MNKKAEDVEMLFPDETTDKVEKKQKKSSNIKAKYITVISLICVIVAFCVYGGIVVLMEKENADLSTPPLQITDNKNQIKDINLTDITIEVNETHKPDMVLMPKDATTNGFVWTVEDQSIATVSTTGEVTGVSIGKTILYVTTRDAKVATSTTVTVVEETIVNQDCLMGDINKDGLIDNIDVFYLIKYINNNSSTNQKRNCLDINADGLINYLDVIELQKLIYNK